MSLEPNPYPFPADWAVAWGEDRYGLRQGDRRGAAGDALDSARELLDGFAQG